MGKIKTARQKFHFSKQSDDPVTVKNVVPDYKPLPVAPINSNIFAGLDISIDKINKLVSKPIPEDNDDNDPAPDLVKIVKEKPANKKDKIRQRREQLLKKLDTLEHAKRKTKEKTIKRRKTAIVGDLNSLKDALPSLDSLLKLKPNPQNIKTGITKIDSKLTPNAALPQLQITSMGISKLSRKQKKELKNQKLKKLAKEYNQRFNSFQKVLDNENFKKNPRDVIATHIKMKLEKEAKEHQNRN